MGRLTVGLLLALAVGCGGGSQQAETITPRAPRPTEATTAAAPSPRDAPPLNAAELEEKLLALDDLPAGWTTAPEEEDEDSGTTEWCGRDLEEEFEPGVEAAVDFQKDDFGPFLSHSVERHEGGGAKEAIDAFIETAQECEEWTETDPDAGETTFRLSPLSFPKLGDQTVAVRISGDNDFVSFAGDVVVWRRGDLLSLLINVGIGGDLDSALTEEMARKADAKL